MELSRRLPGEGRRLDISAGASPRCRGSPKLNSPRRSPPFALMGTMRHRSHFWRAYSCPQAMRQFAPRPRTFARGLFHGADKLRAPREPCESYSDVIMRIVAGER